MNNRDFELEGSIMENVIDYFDRCSNCIHFNEYFFDEYDSDCWCSLFEELRDGYCEKFERLS